MSPVGLTFIQYLNQMSFRHYWSESSIKVGILMKQDERR